MPRPLRSHAASPTARRAASIAARSPAPWAKRAKAPCSRPCSALGRLAGHSVPGERHLFQALAADAGEGACYRTPAAAPIKVAGAGIAEQRPDDQTVEPSHVKRMAAALKQMLAEPQALVEGIEVEFVDFALVAPALARVAEGGIAGHRTAHVQHQGAVAGFHGVAPPFRGALAHHAVEMALRDDAAIGKQPGLPENVGKRLGIGWLAAAHPHFCA